MKKIIAIALLLTLCAGVQAEVYKRIDADGNVEYTDTRQGSKEKSIPLPPSTTYTPPVADNAAPAAGQAAQFVNYESLTITQPTVDETVRENSGNVTVTVSSTPELQAEHRFVVLIDGIKMAEGQSTSLQVNDLDRGTHTVQVQIVDAASKVITRSRLITFHLARISTLQQPGTSTDSPYTLPEPYQSPSPYELPEPYQNPSPYQLPEPYRPAPK